MKGAKRVVLKVGSATLSGGRGVDRDYVADLVRQVVEVREFGWQAIIVSSGAIVAGVERLGFDERPSDMPSLQAAASVGQVTLMATYAEALAAHGLTAGQVLLTQHDTAHRDTYLHARDTLDRLLALDVVPVVNENDTVVVDEIRFGDNDGLAALVATLVGADLVVLLTDIEGLYDSDPRLSEEAQLLAEVDDLTDDLLGAAGGSGSEVGSGGMRTKLDAARVLMKAGIPLVICDGRRQDVVTGAVRGESVGTTFRPGETPISARKLWIALAHKPAGEIIIDEGARDALVRRNTSLLPAGVVAVSGVFEAGDAVVLKDQAGAVVARGLTELSSAELDRVKGLKSSQIAEVLPGVAGKEVVHRDRLVVL